MITKRPGARQDACEVLSWHQDVSIQTIPQFELTHPSRDAGAVPRFSATIVSPNSIRPSQARRRTVGDREDGRSKAAYHSVVSIYAEAAPDGLDQRVGGHRERIAGGIPVIRRLHYRWKNASVSWGYGGVLSPSHHPAEQLITSLL